MVSHPAFALLACMIFAASVAAAPKIEIAPVRESGMARCGETGIFKITVRGEDGEPLTKGRVVCAFSDERFQPLAETEHDLAEGNPFETGLAMAKPGFLRCTARIDGGSAFAVIAFEPEKIVSEQTKPADFEAFWMREKAEALKLPLDVKLEPLARISTPEYTGYAISFANVGGGRMYGYLSVPTGPGPFPAGITLPGAGPGYTKPAGDYPFGSTIVLTLNIHPYPVEPETAKERYAELNKEEFYYFHGLPKIRDYVYYKAFMGICRGIRYLTERSDWDRRNLQVWGSSQGGGLTIATAALNPEVVTAAAVNVPAMGELVHGFRGPRANWEKIMARPEGPTLLPYFDTCNFAPMIRCPMIWSVALRDESCYPHTVYAAYNRVTAPKFLWVTPWMGHDFDPAYTAFRRQWLVQQLH